MSLVTSFVLFTSFDEAGAEPFLEGIRAMLGGGTAVPLSVDHVPGPKAFQCVAYAAAGNYWDTRTMQELLDSVRWQTPSQVIIMCCTENSPATVYRPGGTA